MDKRVTLADVVVVIPAYNEGPVIADTVRRALAVSRQWRVVVIDDGSEDDTSQQAIQAGADVIRHPYNRGNGSSVKTAIMNLEQPVVAILDADGQLPPEALPSMIQKMDQAEMVVGARHKDQMGGNWIRGLGNKILCLVASHISGHTIPDLTCGLRVFYRERALEFYHLYPTRFSFPSTSTLAFLTCNYRVEFHPIIQKPRPAGTESKIREFRDGIRFMAIIFRIVLLFHPWRFFLPLSFFLFLLGLIHEIVVLFIFGKLVLSGTFTILTMCAFFLFCFGLLSEQVAEMRVHLSHIVHGHSVNHRSLSFQYLKATMPHGGEPSVLSTRSGPENDPYN
ncbi:MAG: glycosyltransferase family 2 protein [Magnetococcales bacterium]|nr:glycosyltransferase family 2 protein [Magnetococcales bacterium]